MGWRRNLRKRKQGEGEKKVLDDWRNDNKGMAEPDTVGGGKRIKWKAVVASTATEVKIE